MERFGQHGLRIAVVAAFGAAALATSLIVTDPSAHAESPEPPATQSEAPKTCAPSDISMIPEQEIPLTERQLDIYVAMQRDIDGLLDEADSRGLPFPDVFFEIIAIASRHGLERTEFVDVFENVEFGLLLLQEVEPDDLPREPGLLPRLVTRFPLDQLDLGALPDACESDRPSNPVTHELRFPANLDILRRYREALRPSPS